MPEKPDKSSTKKKFENIQHILVITEIPEGCLCLRDWKPFGSKEKAKLGDLIDSSNLLCYDACKKKNLGEALIVKAMEFFEIIPIYIDKLGDCDPKELVNVKIVVVDIEKMKGDRRNILKNIDHKLTEAIAFIKDDDKYKKYYLLFQISEKGEISLYGDFNPERIVPSDPVIIQTEKDLMDNLMRLCRHSADIRKGLPKDWKTLQDIEKIIASIRDECLLKRLDTEQTAARGFRAVSRAFYLSTGLYANYTPQYYPGSTKVGINRIKHMSGVLERLRDISEADVVAIMGHRAPGANYASVHPPLKEMGEPDCPIRQMVAPTAGAAAGDRVRYSQWTDSMYFAPSTPYWRSYWGAINCRGCDPGTMSDRQIMEARERDIEVYAKGQYDSEMTDVALCSMRSCDVLGHSKVLDKNGMMFDILARTEMGKDGNVYAVKDQVGNPLDKKINLGKPMNSAEAKERTTIFRVDGVPFGGKVGARKYDEAVEALLHIWELRSKWGFRPE
jgi:methyl-coenzyme M reductase gamma subunit